MSPATSIQGRRSALLLALVVLGLLAGLSGLHHLVGGQPEHVTVTRVDVGELLPVAPPDDGHGSDVLHLCLAVLTAMAPVMLGWLLWPAFAIMLVSIGTGGTRSEPRAPPGAPARLALLCVSRT